MLNFLQKKKVKVCEDNSRCIEFGFNFIMRILKVVSQEEENHMIIRRPAPQP